jgi:hypothetical protein
MATRLLLKLGLKKFGIFVNKGFTNAGKYGIIITVNNTEEFNMQNQNFFYKTGIDITNAKQMWNFLNKHYTYYTMNSWNGLNSVANNVKIYNLGLTGDYWQALAFLESDDYFEVNDLIHFWENDHKGYKVYFNGRSGGYLVLCNDDNNSSVLPDWIWDYDNYDDFKEYVREQGWRVKDFLRELREYTQLVQDFDKLCDELRLYVQELANSDFKAEKLVEIVDTFNEYYADDLCFLNFSDVEIVDGKADLEEIKSLESLTESFVRVAKLKLQNTGYKLALDKSLAYITD